MKFNQTTESEFDLIAFQNQFIFVKAQQNNGFAAGNNIALNAILKVSGFDYYVWLLNNDTVVEKESLKNQISYLLKQQNERIGILGSKLIYYFEQDKIQAIGGKFNETFYISTHIGEQESIIKSKEEFPEIDYVIGASMIVRNQFLKEVGTLSEDFFLYYEELDWAKRAKKHNWNIDWCQDSIIFHKVGASIGSSYKSKQKSFFSEINIFQSRKIFVKKYYKLSSRFYLSSFLLILNRVRKGKLKLGLELLKITFGK
ncbi:GT2 family glycosyltransferase [Flavobacterium aquidurense]|nr:GT2 family glycosyltransferase [Flavobacterium aquidurense]